jgi:hypothetical protein
VAAAIIDPQTALRAYEHLVGTTGGSVEWTASRERVRAFRAAIGMDPDEPGVPLTFFCPDPIITAERIGLPRPNPYPNRIDGGTEWLPRRRMSQGETVRLTGRIAGMTAKQGSERTGAMLLTDLEITAHDRDGRVLGIARSTSVSYQGADDA